MKKLTKEKRNQLIFVALGTVALLILVGLGLIRPQLGTLDQIAGNIKAAQDKLQTIQNTLKHVDTTTRELNEGAAALSNAEADMASGDLYSWTYDTIRRFKLKYKIEIPEIGRPTVENVDLLPSFPYKQVRFTITGTAYYHDLGKFIADFENSSPHTRIVNLALAPSATAGGDGEKLLFQMDIVALIKPNS